MPTTVDERIVKMGFDTKEFSDGIGPTLSKLEALKQALTFDKTVSPSMNLSGIAASIDQLNDKFSTLGIVGMTVIQNITNSAIEMGKRIASAVSVDSLKQGFNEYELQMDSVKTIQASTGETIPKINQYLEELNEYADKTIYSFSDMTRNIGKFTNAGVKLNDAVMAIKGISNEAALSGANANEASRAMYNFAQALSAGYVKLIDWKSIENANMATVEFKTQLLENAAAMGTVKKQANGMYKVLTKNMQGKVMESTIDATHNFNDSLSFQWMTTKVLTSTLKKYADETTQIGKKAYAAAQEVTTFSKLIDTVKEALGSSWTKTWQLVIGDFNESKELWTGVANQINKIIDPISDARNAMLQFWKENGGRTAMIESVANAWNALKTALGAVSEGYRSLFPAMTGEKLLALTDRIKELTEKMMLSEKQLRKVKNISEGFFSIFKIISRLLTSAVEKVKPILGIIKPIATTIVDVAEVLALFVKGIANADDMMKYISENTIPAFKFALGIIRDALNIDPNNIFGKILGHMGDAADDLSNRITACFTAFSKFGLIDSIRETIYQVSEALKHVLFDTLNIDEKSAVGKSLTWLINSVRNIGYIFTSVATDIKNGDFDDILYDIGFWISQIIPGSDKLVDKIKNVGAWASNTFNAMKKALSPLTTGFNEATTSVKNFFAKFGKNGDSVEAKNFSSHFSIFTMAGKLINGFAKILKTTGEGIIQAGTKIGAAIPRFFEYLGSADFANVLRNLNIILSGVLRGSLIKLLNTKPKFEFIESIKGAIDNISSIGKKLTDSVNTVATSIGGAFDSISSKLLGKEKDIGATLLKTAGAISILTVSLFVLSKINPNNLSHGIAALSIEIGILLGTFKIMQSLMTNDKLSQKSLNAFTTQLIKMSIALVIFSTSFKALAQLEWEDISQGLLGVSGMVGILVGAVALLSKQNMTGSLSQISKGLIVFAAGMKILSLSVKTLGAMDFGTMAQGLVGVVTLLEAINLFTREANMNSMSMKSAASILITMEAVKVLAKTATSFAGMAWEELAKGLLGTMTLLGAINVFIRDANFTGLSAKAAFSILTVANAVKILSAIVMSFSGLSWPEFTKGLLGVLTILESLNLFTQEAAMNSMSAKSVVGILALTLAVKGLAGVVTSLGGLSWSELAKGLIGLAGAIAALTIPLVVLGNQSPRILLGAVALDAAALSLVAIVPAIMMLSKIKMENLVKSILAIGGAFTVLGVAGAAFGAFAPILLAGAASILALGAASAIAGVGTLALAAGIGALVAALAAGGVVFAANAKLATAVINELFNNIPVVLINGAKNIRVAMTDSVGQIAASAVNMIKTIVGVVTEGIPYVVGAVMTGLISVLTALKDNSHKIVEVISGILVEFLTAIQKYLPIIATAAIKAIIALANAIANGIRENGPLILAAVRNVISSIIELCITAVQDILRLIPVVGEGLASGLEGTKDIVRKTLAPETFKDIGRDAVGQKGLAGGIQSEKQTVSYAAADIGDSVTSGLNDSMATADDLGSEFGLGLSDGLLSTKGLLGDSAASMASSITDNLDMLDLSDYGKLYATDFASGLDISQSDLADSTEGLTGSILDTFGDSNKDFENAGGKNVGSYLKMFTSDSTLRTAERSSSQLADKSVNGLDKKREAADAGRNVGYGFADGLSDGKVVRTVETKATALAGTALSAMAKKLDSHSPSKEGVKLGQFLGLGFGNGLVVIGSYVAEKAEQLGDTAMNGIKQAIAYTAALASNTDEIVPSISPVLDLSNVQNGFAKMNSMFSANRVVGLRASLSNIGSVGSISGIRSIHEKQTNSDGLLAETQALRRDVKNLGEGLSKMSVYLDKKEVGGILSNEIDRRLGIRYQRNRREGRGNV